MTKTITLPENEKAESSLLASILLDNSIMDYAMARIKPTFFVSPTNAIIFKSMAKLHEERSPIDEATLIDTFQNNAPPTSDPVDLTIKLGELSTGFPQRSKAAVEAYTKIIIANAQKRELVKLGESWKSRLNKPGETIEALIESAQRHLSEIAGNVSKSTLFDAKESVHIAMNDINRILTGTALHLGTGIRPLDKMLGGMSEQELVIIAAQTSQGKTALAVQIAHHLASHQHPVAFFSLEMSIPKIISRFNIFETDLSMGEQHLAINSRKTMEGLEKIAQLPIYCSDLSRIKASQLSVQLKNLANNHPVQAVFIDYLGLIEPEKMKQDNRNLEIAYITRELKLLAMELKIPIVLLAQLNRNPDQRTGKSTEPRLSDLRDSGAIEQDADKVVFIHRPNAKESTTNPFDTGSLIVAKNRNGEIGRVPFDFHRKFMRIA